MSKKLILNMPIPNENGQKSYKDVINSQANLANVFKVGQPKPMWYSLLGDKYARVAHAAQRAFQLDSFAEMFIHEILLPKHLTDGCGLTPAVAYELASMLNELIIEQRGKSPLTDKPVITEVTDEQFAILNHLIDTNECFGELYKQRWNEMINELNK